MTDYKTIEITHHTIEHTLPDVEVPEHVRQRLARAIERDLFALMTAPATLEPPTCNCRGVVHVCSVV